MIRPLCTLLILAAPVLADEKDGMKLLYAQDFSKPEAIKDFTPTDPKAWRLGSADGKSFLEQFAAGKYTPPHRSPVNFALIGGKRFGDFVLEEIGRAHV